MRSMIITVTVCLILALGLGVFCNLYTRHIGRDYQQQIENATILIRENQWEKALEIIQALSLRWEKQARLLSLFADHAQVDTVGLALTQLRVSMEEKEKYHALLYAAELSEALTLIYSRDAFVLKNIL